MGLLHLGGVSFAFQLCEVVVMQNPVKKYLEWRAQRVADQAARDARRRAQAQSPEQKPVAIDEGEQKRLAEEAQRWHATNTTIDDLIDKGHEIQRGIAVVTERSGGYRLGRPDKRAGVATAAALGLAMLGLNAGAIQDSLRGVESGVTQAAATTVQQTETFFERTTSAAVRSLAAFGRVDSTSPEEAQATLDQIVQAARAGAKKQVVTVKGLASDIHRSNPDNMGLGKADLPNQLLSIQRANSSVQAIKTLAKQQRVSLEGVTFLVDGEEKIFSQRHWQHLAHVAHRDFGISLKDAMNKYQNKRLPNSPLRDAIDASITAFQGTTIGHSAELPVTPTTTPASSEIRMGPAPRRSFNLWSLALLPLLVVPFVRRKKLVVEKMLVETLGANTVLMHPNGVHGLKNPNYMREAFIDREVGYWHAVGPMRLLRHANMEHVVPRVTEYKISQGKTERTVSVTFLGEEPDAQLKEAIRQAIDEIAAREKAEHARPLRDIVIRNREEGSPLPFARFRANKVHGDTSLAYPELGAIELNITKNGKDYQRAKEDLLTLWENMREAKPNKSFSSRPFARRRPPSSVMVHPTKTEPPIVAEVAPSTAGNSSVRPLETYITDVVHRRAQAMVKKLHPSDRSHWWQRKSEPENSEDLQANRARVAAMFRLPKNAQATPPAPTTGVRRRAEPVAGQLRAPQPATVTLIHDGPLINSRMDKIVNLVQQLEMSAPAQARAVILSAPDRPLDLILPAPSLA